MIDKTFKDFVLQRCRNRTLCGCHDCTETSEGERKLITAERWPEGTLESIELNDLLKWYIHEST